ncbi:autotransporter outer membrane beta-barrel domain-containing protein [Neisseriaceae bacterium CLB008]
MNQIDKANWQTTEDGRMLAPKTVALAVTMALASPAVWAAEPFAPEIPGYAQMANANTEMIYTNIGSLHQRVGENQVMAWDDCSQCQNQVDAQTWGRLYGKRLKQTGKEQFDSDISMYGFQLGQDLSINVDEATGSRRHTGIMASYGYGKTKFFDQKGAHHEDEKTGTAKSHLGSLGLYSTTYAKNGTYLDLVGQVNYVRNKYKLEEGDGSVKQNGYGAALSAEIGRPFQLGESRWLVEPQAQLTYQYLRLKDPKDDALDVDQKNTHAVRGRLGARLAYNAPTEAFRTKTFYTSFNVLHDFIKPAKVNLEGVALRERYGNTWGEVAVGMQLPIAKSAYLYADARYEHSFDGAKREGYGGTLGLKHMW